jgi:hypothetical protein
VRSVVNFILVQVFDSAHTFFIDFGFVNDQADADLFTASRIIIYPPPAWEIVRKPVWLELNKNTAGAILNVSAALNDPSTRSFILDAPPERWGMRDSAFKVAERTDGTLPGTKPGKSATPSSGSVQIPLKSYLILLLNTWQNVKPTAPQRWIEWLTVLIAHYSRYTPTQIYGFLGQVDFSAKTFKV